MDEESSPFLRNKYWILRHGQSIPNERGIVVSSMENGALPEFGLTVDGINQAKLAGELLNQVGGVFVHKQVEGCKAMRENIRICYSPFSRTKHTAEVVADVINVPLEGPQCKAMIQLRERYFGPTVELQSHEKYSEIWALDEMHPFGAFEGGESVADVASRLSDALAAMEAEFQGCMILVVSHGDPLQILQTILSAATEHCQGGGHSGVNDLLDSRIKSIMVPSVLSQHRMFALETGELRRLI